MEEVKLSNNVDEKEIKLILDSYKSERRYALFMLQDMQNKFQFVPRNGMEMLSKYLDCPISELYAMATFYKALSLKPKGKHIIKCCDGTACHIRGSLNLVGELKRKLGVEPGETTKDGLFSFETVNCMGSCALAPVVVIDEKYYGKVTMEQLPKILDEYREGGK
ncbi:MAG: NAD(P)H-dependent oxidoreductase subunit E [Eubacteriales bacterium]|nr:NAD(P)H-dependent oxidoreductase subunit E [Eubacteriales bacterium]